MKFTVKRIADNLEVKDITSRWQNKNRLIWLLIGVCLTLSSFVVYRSLNPVICRTVEKDKLMMKMYDSMALELKIVGFRDSALTERNLYEYVGLIGCTHPYETTAQALYETGNFSAKSSARFNNLFGFRHNDYIVYSHWTRCVDYMVKNYQVNHNLKKGANYYSWIPASYHGADKSVYNQGVHYIELKLRKKYGKIVDGTQ